MFNSQTFRNNFRRQHFGVIVFHFSCDDCNMFRKFENIFLDFGYKRKTEFKMKLLGFLFATSATASLIKAPGDCYWTSAGSGSNIECLPEFYIKGGCESGSRDNCHIDGLVGSQSFGVHCCPVDRSLSLGGRNNCTWHYGERQGFISFTGDYVSVVGFHFEVTHKI